MQMGVSRAKIALSQFRVLASLSYHIYPNREKNRTISVRRFEGIVSPAYCGTVAQLASKISKENLERVFIAFLLKKKGNMNSGHEAEKRPQRGVSVYAMRTFLLLVATLARIYEVSMIWTYLFMFKLVLSFCVEPQIIQPRKRDRKRHS